MASSPNLNLLPKALTAFQRGDFTVLNTYMNNTAVFTDSQAEKILKALLEPEAFHSSIAIEVLQKSNLPLDFFTDTEEGKSFMASMFFLPPQDFQAIRQVFQVNNETKPNPYHDYEDILAFIYSNQDPFSSEYQPLTLLMGAAYRTLPFKFHDSKSFTKSLAPEKLKINTDKFLNFLTNFENSFKEKDYPYLRKQLRIFTQDTMSLDQNPIQTILKQKITPTQWHESFHETVFSWHGSIEKSFISEFKTSVQIYLEKQALNNSLPINSSSKNINPHVLKI